MRDPESASDHPEEVDGCSGSLVCNGHNFDPLGELVDGDEQMRVPFGLRGW